MRRESGRFKLGLKSVSGALVFAEGGRGISYGEMVEVIGTDSRVRTGRILVASRETLVVEVYEGTEGLSTSDTHVRFLGHGLEVPVAKEMLGRTFDSFGRALDGGPEPLAREWRNVNGAAINPAAREYPRDFLQTGISAIDGMNTLVRGQKLPILSASGLPHNQLAAQIVRQAEVRKGEGGPHAENTCAIRVGVPAAIGGAGAGGTPDSTVGPRVRGRRPMANGLSRPHWTKVCAVTG